MKKLILIIVFALYSNSMNAQFSIIQDGDGETSLQLMKASTVAINAATTSIGFSVSPDNTDKIKWAIHSTANAKDGLAKLFEGGKFLLSGKSGATVIYDMSKYGTRDDPRIGNLVYQFLGGELLYSRFEVIDSTKTFDNQISEQANRGFRINYGWNFLNVESTKTILNVLGPFSAGLSVSLGNKDNTDIIDPVEVITSSRSYSNGAITRTISSTSDAYESNAIAKNLFFSRFNFDFGKHLPGNRLFANIHLTYATDEGLKPVLNPSFGFFVMKNGAPLEAIVGIQLQTSDWSNNRNSEKGRWERTSLVLTAGFPF
ncbi:hypothetical protein GCM10009122_22680 [Fulvivirga kasyanovii]|uniref:DUF481 domain-containing protein n=1 Tax=Fulvivirga kasyanovii TaxID=396812 RepID=A0ABW9RP91_9BACT|nr:hypothetical protein [Fulvivirga kasyanovii]MTI25746.1 hypothetical protein [Fulvivirga kasyanovii]